VGAAVRTRNDGDDEIFEKEQQLSFTHIHRDEMLETEMLCMCVRAVAADDWHKTWQQSVSEASAVITGCCLRTESV
jgi:hypothetical protein